VAQSERHRRHRRVRETPSARYAPPPQPGGVAGILLDSDVVIDAATGRRAGSYLSCYARSHGIEIADALIAAAASTAGLSLWTLNRKHYPMEDLRLYNPPRT
jgi:hypothetical protein